MQGKEKSAGKSQKKSWFQGLKAEFNKIIWTDRNTLMKQTITCTVVTVIMAVLISVMDTGILQVINLLMK